MKAIAVKPAPLTALELTALGLRLSLAYLKQPVETLALAKKLGLLDALARAVYEPLTVAAARIDPNTFIEYCIPTTKGTASKQAAFHREWQQILTEAEVAALLVGPRSHGKSVQVSSRVVYELGRNVALRFKIICAKEGGAATLVTMIKKLITTNARVQRVFPQLKVDPSLPDSRTEFTVLRPSEFSAMRDPSVVGAGWNTAAAGGRADRLICDDVVDETNAVVNPGLRPKVITTMQNNWFSLVADDGVIWWLATPYHTEDATHVFRRENIFDREWWRPAITNVVVLDSQGNPTIDPITNEAVTVEVPLWPEWWSLEKLHRKKRSLTPLPFARQYLLQVMSDEDKMFPFDLVVKPSSEPTLYRIGQCLPIDTPEGNIPDSWPTYAGIDLASTLGSRGAYFVMWTLAYSLESQRLYLKELVRCKASFPDIIKIIVAGYEKHKWANALVENNGFQIAVATQLNHLNKSIPISGVHTGTNKHDASIGIQGLAAVMSNGLFALPTRDIKTLREDDPALLSVFFNELLGYPGARYSDTVMGLWFAWRAFSMGYNMHAENYAGYVQTT